MKYTFKTKPRPHQREALKHLLSTSDDKPDPGGGLQVRMRYGKSKVAIDFAACCYLKKRSRRALIVTVVSGLGVWENEIAKHCPVPWIIVNREGTVQAEGRGLYPLPDPAVPPLLFRIVNFDRTFDRLYYEGKQWVPSYPARALEKFKANVMIVDEGHHIGDPMTLVSRAVQKLGQAAQYRVIMSGTSFHRKPFYVYGQAKYYNDGLTFDSLSWTKFREHIAILGGPSGKEVQEYMNLDWMMNCLKRWYYIGEDLPTLPPVVNVIPFHLTGSTLKHYETMERESIIALESGTVIEASILLARHAKLQMMAGGWIKDESGRYHQLGRDKFNVAKDRFREYALQGINKVVVGCRFRSDLRSAADAAKAAGFEVIGLHGGISAGDRPDRIKRFNRYPKDHPIAFVAQIRAAREAIDLSSADTLMHYSLSDSYVDHAQFSDRIAKYDERRTLQHDFLTGIGTRDEVSYESMMLKKDVAELLKTDPRRVMQITSRLRER